MMRRGARVHHIGKFDGKGRRGGAETAKVGEFAAGLTGYLRSLAPAGVAALLGKAFRRSPIPISHYEDHPSRSWQAQVLDQLVPLLNMPANWDGYGAPAVSREAAMFALEVLQRAMQPSTPAPQVVPSSVGGVQLEWHENDIDLELHVTAPYRSKFWFEDHRAGTVASENFRLIFPRSLRRFVAFIICEKIGAAVHPLGHQRAVSN